MISKEWPLGSSQYTPRPPSLAFELARPVFAGVGPVRQSADPDPAEDLVEVGFGDQERVVLRADRAVVIGEVQGDAVAGLHGQEWPECLGGR